jgi:hypothetical protein
VVVWRETDAGVAAAHHEATELAEAIFEFGRKIAAEHGLEARSDGPAVDCAIVGKARRLTARGGEAIGVDVLAGIAADEIEQRRRTGEDARARQHGPAQAGVGVDVGVGGPEGHR